MIIKIPRYFQYTNIQNLNITYSLKFEFPENEVEITFFGLKIIYRNGGMAVDLLAEGVTNIVQYFGDQRPLIEVVSDSIEGPAPKHMELKPSSELPEITVRYPQDIVNTAKIEEALNEKPPQEVCEVTEDYFEKNHMLDTSYANDTPEMLKLNEGELPVTKHLNIQGCEPSEENTSFYDVMEEGEDYPSELNIPGEEDKFDANLIKDMKSIDADALFLDGLVKHFGTGEPITETQQKMWDRVKAKQNLGPSHRIANEPIQLTKDEVKRLSADTVQLVMDVLSPQDERFKVYLQRAINKAHADGQYGENVHSFRLGSCVELSDQEITRLSINTINRIVEMHTPETVLEKRQETIRKEIRSKLAVEGISIADDLSMIARTLPDNISVDTCEKINQAAIFLEDLIKGWNDYGKHQARIFSDLPKMDEGLGARLKQAIHERVDEMRNNHQYQIYDKVPTTDTPSELSADTEDYVKYRLIDRIKLKPSIDVEPAEYLIIHMYRHKNQISTIIQAYKKGNDWMFLNDRDWIKVAGNLLLPALNILNDGRKEITIKL